MKMFHISPFSDQIVNQCHFLTSDSHPLRQVIFIKSPIYGKLNLALNFAHKVLSTFWSQLEGGGDP